MALVLRKLDRLSAWKVTPSWVTLPDISADTVFSGFRTDSGSLSFYRVRDDPSLERTVAALAGNRDSFCRLEYVVVDEGQLVRAGFTLHDNEGNTADSEVNALHVDVHELTGRALSELISVFFYDGQTDARTKPEVKKLVLGGLDSGALDKSKLHPDLAARINAI